MADIFEVLIFSVISVVYLFIIAKLLGKKQISQLNFVDYVIGISLGSIAAGLATETDKPFYYYLIAMTIFFLFSLMISYGARMTPGLKNLLHGKPNTLVYNGKIDYRQLKKCKLDVNDLLSLCRQKGYFDINDVAFAVLEPSGKLSVIPTGSQKPAVAEDLGIELEQQSLTNYLIADGRISMSGLNEINKTPQWLYDQLGIKTPEDLDKIILASYDDQLQKFDVHYKEDFRNKNLTQRQENQEQRSEKKPEDKKEQKKSNSESQSQNASQGGYDKWHAEHKSKDDFKGKTDNENNDYRPYSDTMGQQGNDKARDDKK